MAERRQEKRFAVPDNAFAVFHSNSIIVTSLIDINMDGLAFEYMIDSDDHVGNAQELDIFCADDDIYDFHLQNVPFEITSQEAVSVADQFVPLKKIRCGVKFGRLNQDQLSRLQHFVSHYTTVKAKDAGRPMGGGGGYFSQNMSFVF